MDAKLVISDKNQITDFGSIPTRIEKSDGTNMMHHKFMVLGRDGKWCEVITGSYNYTNNARGNAENIVISNDPKTVGKFVKEFEEFSWWEATVPSLVRVEMAADEKTVEEISSAQWEFIVKVSRDHNDKKNTQAADRYAQGIAKHRLSRCKFCKVVVFQYGLLVGARFVCMKKDGKAIANIDADELAKRFLASEEQKEIVCKCGGVIRVRCAADDCGCYVDRGPKGRWLIGAK
jgi:hypothetical protein